MEGGPVVTVIVLTYNSSGTVIETLDSIRKQSYRNIELIVSDDKSADNSVEICREWIDANRERFVNCEVIVPEANTGTAGNCNRGIKASHGEWFRIIGGDDLIPEDAITLQINHVTEHPEIRILNGYSIYFKKENGVFTELPVADGKNRNAVFYSLSAQEQYQYLLHHYKIGLTVGTLINRSVFEQVTMYDEKYPLIEDLPFWLNVTKAGIKYHHFDAVSMLYRVHNSVTHSSGDRIANQTFWETRKRIIDDMIKPNIQWYAISCRKRMFVDDLIYWFTFKAFKNKRSLMGSAVLAILYKL